MARAGGLDEEAVGILPIPVSGFEPAAGRGVAGDARAPGARVRRPRRRHAQEHRPAPRRAAGDPECPSAAGRCPARAGPGPSRGDGAGRVGRRAPPAGNAVRAPLVAGASGSPPPEAIASGLPVVTTPSGGPEALVRDSGGGVVLEGFSPGELAETVRGLLADPRARGDAPPRPGVRPARALRGTLPRATGRRAWGHSPDAAESMTGDIPRTWPREHVGNVPTRSAS